MGELAKRRVLVVEDEALIALMTEAMLLELGCEVAVAHTLVEARAAVQDDRRPDAVTLDMNLNGESAAGLAAELEAKGIPFVIVTGYDDAGVLQACQSKSILHKPFLAPELAAALRALHF
jgi:CheY-like chemotaxis protein